MLARKEWVGAIRGHLKQGQCESVVSGKCIERESPFTH